MLDKENYKLEDFLPYLLTRAADRLSLGFQSYYKDKYNMLRTEWRVLFHLGSFGDMTAKEICARSDIHKTKTSRAVSALEKKGYLERKIMENDRRHSLLKLSKEGRVVFEDLREEALKFDAQIRAELTAEENRVLRKLLQQFMDRQPK